MVRGERYQRYMAVWSICVTKQSIFVAPPYWISALRRDNINTSISRLQIQHSSYNDDNKEYDSTSAHNPLPVIKSSSSTVSLDHHGGMIASIFCHTQR